MNPLDLVQCGIERLDSFSKAVIEAQHNLHGMDESDYSAAQRGMLDELDQKGKSVFVLLGFWDENDTSDWRILPVSLAHCYLYWLQKKLHELMPAKHPKREYFCPESFGLRLIADWENTLLRGFLRWAVVQAHKPSSAVHSLLQMHSSDDAAKYVVPKPKGDMKVALVRVTDLPELLDHWDQRVVSGPAEEEMVEVCRSNKPNFRRSILQGLFVLAWKVPRDYEDMWMDGQGFAIPDVPESI
ncbi:hypothetical protein FPRO06_04642 [Fusarium proliferatum]|nr:hypothetical protein FPRO03_06027 [Fusarium proliferatum]KAG4268746.1 hypothetical protein FPRO04_03835 [Fusarium proliferatum]KAG4289820.1 hypothetical protein FPRO06_04642 [Fusarium proliferatum]CVL04720.1 uncharacterized protein FPRN_03417 [Fusarium proliferatum]